MAHDQETRRELRKLYVTGKSLKEAADRLDVAESTARRWRDQAEADGDDWERARTAAAMIGEGARSVVEQLIADFVVIHADTLASLKDDQETSAIIKAKALSVLADAFSKTMAAAGRAAPEISELAVAQDVVMRLGDFVKENYPQHLAAFTEILEPFAEELANIYVQT